MSQPRQSLELVLARADDEAIRVVWQRLSQAGLPSLHDHRSSSNRPHLTLVTSPVITPDQERQLAAAVSGRLPIRTGWGAVTTFGPGPYAAARLVRPSPELLALHGELAGILEIPDGELTAPARWTPHVSFAMRVPADQRDAVVACLSEPAPEASAVLTWASARRWDPVARREWRL